VVTWEEVAGDFQPEGALRDIYVTEANLAVWQSCLDYLRVHYSVEFFLDSETAPLPGSVADIFAARLEGSPLMNFRVAGMEIACHFFSDHQVELDFWPQQVHDGASLAALIAFVVELGRLTKRKVLVTPENCQQAPILRYDPTEDDVFFVAPPYA
jgi:hypothetical protein